MSSVATCFTTARPPSLATTKTTKSLITATKQYCICSASDSFATLIDSTKSIKQLSHIHAYLLRHGLETHQVLNLKLQRSYSSLGRLDYAVVLFNHTQNPDVFFYTVIIHAHVSANLHCQALHLYVEMLSENIELNAFTFSAILKDCPLNVAEVLYGQAIKMGYDLNTYVRTALVDVYARSGDIACARQLFDTMPQKSLVSSTIMMTSLAKHGDVDGAQLVFDGMEIKDVVCWNVIINGYVQHGRPSEALSLFRQMLSANMCPDGATLVAVLSACGQLGAMESGRWVHAYMKNKGIQMNVHIGAALVDMYSKCGSSKDARMVFGEVNSKDVVVWNAMISGYAVNGFSKEALQVFNDMRQLSVTPTEITFIEILTVCAHAGLVLEGWKIFQLMQAEYGIEPKEHYGCMVNLLGRAGQLNEAFKIVRGMNIQPDHIIWRTLLSGCKLHGNSGLGEEIVDLHVDWNLASSGTCVLLSNMYMLQLAIGMEWQG